MARDTDSETGTDVRRELLELLLDKARQDTYPSSTMLDQIESLLVPEEVEEYAELLLAKLEGETYPSNALVGRVMALGGRSA